MMMSEIGHDLRGVAVVIPCYRCDNCITDVVTSIPRDVGMIVCVNDCSDDDTGAVLALLAKADSRITVITHEKNLGVGGATMTGYHEAIRRGARVLVKIDSDGQMNPVFIGEFAAPILAGEADYVKGNRFFDIDLVRQMPGARLVGNAGLTLFSRVSSGYWELSDPANGYTAISSEVFSLLPAEKLHKRYFFESDILFRLNTFGAVVVEQPLETRYGDEVSNLSVLHSLITFPFLHARNFLKRVFYSYVLRNFDVATINLIGGILLCCFGLVFGLVQWFEGAAAGTPATAGTVMLSVTPLLVGFQMLLSFLHQDIARTPHNPIHTRIARQRTLKSSDFERVWHGERIGLPTLPPTKHADSKVEQ